MSEEKTPKTEAETVPEAEYAEPSWAKVEPDEIASVRLFVQVSVLSFIILVIMLGLWRFLAWQTSNQLKDKESSDANNQALILQKEASQVLQARSPHPETMRARMPVKEAAAALVKRPDLFKPLSAPPKPGGAPATTPKMPMK